MCEAVLMNQIGDCFLAYIKLLSKCFHNGCNSMPIFVCIYIMDDIEDWIIYFMMEFISFS